jgi:hypothetical protein
VTAIEPSDPRAPGRAKVVRSVHRLPAVRYGAKTTRTQPSFLCLNMS